MNLNGYTITQCLEFFQLTGSISQSAGLHWLPYEQALAFFSGVESRLIADPAALAFCRSPACTSASKSGLSALWASLWNLDGCCGGSPVASLFHRSCHPCSRVVGQWAWILLADLFDRLLGHFFADPGMECRPPWSSAPEGCQGKISELKDAFLEDSNVKHPF